MSNGLNELFRTTHCGLSDLNFQKKTTPITVPNLFLVFELTFPLLKLGI